MSAGLSEASKYSRIALYVLIANGFLLVVSYASPFWTTTRNGHAGLWISCEGRLCYERWNIWVEDWVHAVQFMMSLAFAFWTFALGAQFLYVFKREFSEDKRFVLLAAICVLTSGILVVLSLITYAAGQPYYSTEMLSWAYVLGWMTAVTSLFIFAVLLKELKFDENDPLIQIRAPQVVV